MKVKADPCTFTLPTPITALTFSTSGASRTEEGQSKISRNGHSDKEPPKKAYSRCYTTNNCTQPSPSISGHKRRLHAFSSSSEDSSSSSSLSSSSSSSFSSSPALPPTNPSWTAGSLLASTIASPSAISPASIAASRSPASKAASKSSTASGWFSTSPSSSAFRPAGNAASRSSPELVSSDGEAASLAAVATTADFLAGRCFFLATFDLASFDPCSVQLSESTIGFSVSGANLALVTNSSIFLQSRCSMVMTRLSSIRSSNPVLQHWCDPFEHVARPRH
ncbi:hypothetical protein GMOD_00006035 [Pyrenophora seminiperda CCB06]|uniref:Uncharacterized protein n=1 Tax=Pyrenophora seminiperda CCB06 TaxID=1302712 RepID=A0A3M7M4G8_9PLEO|nr:hypothetical protein GMOD_00006035 [Pyrenophora seminiperda CCB06]